MGTTHNGGNETLVHKHFKGVNIRSIRADPTKQQHHAKEDSFTGYYIDEVDTHYF